MQTVIANSDLIFLDDVLGEVLCVLCSSQAIMVPVSVKDAFPTAGLLQLSTFIK